MDLETVVVVWREADMRAWTENGLVEVHCRRDGDTDMRFVS